MFVYFGTLSGSGVIGGTTFVGSGGTDGTGGFLVPEFGDRTVLTIRKNVVFQFKGNFTCTIDNTQPHRVASLSAKGVRILSGANFNLVEESSTRRLRSGTVYTVIRNTFSQPTVGTFDNLPDGGTITVNHDTFLANYAGGDGNDLTLTVR